MYRIVVLVLCYHVLSQPVSNEPSSRLARDLIECCPCPGARDDQDLLADGSQLAGADGVDDCPCRVRGADSEGASSLFLPAALRPDGSHLRPTDPKEDPKNILEPEVVLAASVLDTLREATEQEYRDALQREAARNAAEPDAVPEESARNVVIVVNPNDFDDDEDFISEASHIQESRCINPSSTSLDTMRSSATPINMLPETFKLPKLKHLELPHRNLLHFDSNLGASNVEKSIVDTKGNVPKFSSQAPAVKHTTPLKSILDNQNDGFRFSKPSLKLGKFNDNESIQGFKLSLIPKLKSNTNIDNDDLSSAPNNVHHLSETTNDKTRYLFRNDKLPLHLRNLLKLKDVELIPNMIRNKSWAKPKLDVSKFAIPTLFKSIQNKNCKGEAKYTNDVAKKNSEQGEIDEVYDNNTDTSTIENTDENTRLHSIHELNTPFRETVADSISNKNIKEVDENDAIESKEINLDVLSSPSQVKPLIIRTDVEKDLEPILSPKSVTDCNSLHLKESDINTDESNTDAILISAIDSNLSEFEPDIILTEDIGNFNDDTKISDSLQDQDINTDQDSETDSSNIILFNLGPLENQERTDNEPKETQEIIAADSELVEEHVPDSKIIPASFTKTIENRNLVPPVKEMPSLSETLSSLRENVVKQLGNFKKPLIKSKLFRTLSVDETINVDNEGVRTIDSNINQMTASLDPENTADYEATENVSDISMNDLQNMSDKLLDSNLNNQSKENIREFTENNIADETNYKLSEVNDNSDSELSETNLNAIEIGTKTNVADEHERSLSREENNKNDSELSETNINAIDIGKKNNDADDHERSLFSKQVEKNACSTNLDTKNAYSEEKVTKSVTQDTDKREMETGASDTVFNTLPNILDSLNPNLKLRSPLLSDMGLQPSGDPLNLLGKPVGDVLSLNNNLPTLDNLRERLANIFNTNDGSVENDPSSLETDFTNDSPPKTMAIEPSTRNNQRELPLLKQLEKISNNNNIIQKKPKTLTPFDTLTKSRLLDLNSYRAHLPSPHSLDLKPIKIEPWVRNRAEKNKPSINFGSDRTALRKTKPSSTLVNPLDRFPTFEELSNTLRSNTKSLLNSPVHSDLNLLSENLRSHDIEDVAKKFRINTEKTFKGIQRKMKSSLKTPKSHNPLGDSLAKPQELFDDMSDRLKGLHYDLNDRLSSFRENILDSSRIKSLDDQPRKASNRNVMTNLRTYKTKSPSPRLHTSASTTMNQEIDPHSLGLESRNYVHPDRSQKTQAAAVNAPAPARVELPKTASPTLSYFHRISPPSRQNPIMTESFRKRIPTTFLNEDVTHFKDTKSPLFRSALRPFNNQRQQNKVTISFGTTTARPVLPSRPVIRVPNMSTSRFQELNPSSFTFSKENAAAKSIVPSGKFKTLRTSAPVPSPIDEEFEDTLNNFINEDLPTKDTKLKSSVYREMSKPNTLIIDNHSNKLKSANIFEDEIENYASKSAAKTSHFSPKVTENAFLSNAANVRKLGKVPKPEKDVRTEQLDMLRAPTENSGIVMDEPLKENVSYRCRMVCAKDIR